MNLTLHSPACLLLGMVDIDGQPHQLGIALQHPPIQLDARNSALLLVTGGRADLANRQAEQVIQHYHVPHQGEIEIELAIPSFMGLGSAGMLGMSVARTLAELHGLPSSDPAALAEAAGLARAEALERHAFAQGGLLLIAPDGSLTQRAELPQHEEDDAWVWVLVLPRVPASTPDTLEAERRADLLAAAHHLSATSGQLCQQDLIAAAAQDNIAAFAETLAEIQRCNADALRLADLQHPLSNSEHQLLDLMRAHGALVAGHAQGGLALYALIQGAGPSRELRRALANTLGFFGGTAMASICANQGARISQLSRQ